MNVVQRDVDLDDIEERLKKYLYANGGKVTNERIRLLRVLYTHDGHYSVDEIGELTKEEGQPISRATIYRTLDLLVQSGLVRRLAFDGFDTRYEASLTTGHHDHIICTDCHKLIEFYDERLETIQDRILEEYQLKPVHHVHQLYGACIREDCPEKRKKAR